MRNREVLTAMEGLSSESVSNIVDALDELQVGELAAAQVFPGRFGKTVVVQAVTGKKYYIGLSVYGFVEMIRSDSTTGKIVYAPLD